METSKRLQMDFGKLTDDQLLEVLTQALRETPDNDALKVIVVWAQERDLVDELIADLEGIPFS